MLFGQAQANLNGFKPHRIGLPVNPSYTLQEWRTIMAAQQPSPEHFLGFKRGTRPQPGDYPLVLTKFLEAYESKRMDIMFKCLNKNTNVPYILTSIIICIDNSKEIFVFQNLLGKSMCQMVISV
jgi:hypothetical protein